MIDEAEIKGKLKQLEEIDVKYYEELERIYQGTWRSPRMNHDIDERKTMIVRVRDEIQYVMDTMLWILEEGEYPLPFTKQSEEQQVEEYEVEVSV